VVFISVVKAFISIHCNSSAFNVWGTEIFIYKGSKKGRALAESVEEYLKPVVPKWRGIKESSKFYVLKHTKMPAILIECGFLSNKEEAVLLSSENYQERLAVAIAKGINSWLKRSDNE